MKNKAAIKIYITALTVIFSASCSFAIEEITPGATLSLDDCKEIALKNSPQIKIYNEYVKITEAQEGQAKSSYFPTLGGSIGYDFANTDSKYRSSHSNSTSARVALNQLICSFGKVLNRVRMQKFYKIAAEYDYQNAVLSTVSRVKNSYYAVLAAKANLEIQEANVLVNERQYERTKAFYEEGMVSKIDLVNEEVYLSDAKTGLVSAENTYQNAVIALNTAMSVPNAPEYKIKNTETFNLKDDYAKMNLVNIANTVTKEDGTIDIKPAVLTTSVEKTELIEDYKFQKYPYTLEESVETAYKNRPDLLSLEASAKAVKEALKYTQKEYLPDLTGSVGYNWNNNMHYNSNGVTMGAYLSTNNLNFMEIKNSIKESKSRLEVANLNVDAIKQEIFFDVQKAYVNMIQLEKNIPLMHTKVKQTLENYELADARYEVGLGNFIELQDAKENYNNAQRDYIQTIFAYNEALTELQTAMGEK